MWEMIEEMTRKELILLQQRIALQLRILEEEE